MSNANAISKIEKIIFAQKGKGIVSKRIAALEAEGFTVSHEGKKYNWGRSGTVKEIKGLIFAQLKCATGGRGRNGYSVNHCEIYEIACPVS